MIKLYRTNKHTHKCVQIKLNKVGILCINILAEILYYSFANVIIGGNWVKSNGISHFSSGYI